MNCIAMRQLKYHEEKLLKKTDFLNWKQEKHHRENDVIRRYHLQERDDYVKYNNLVGNITQLANRLKNLPIHDIERQKHASLLVDKLYAMGVIPTKKMSAVERVTVSAFCRRRLPVVLVKLRMASTLKEAVSYVEQGHIRVGPNVMTDPAFLISRTLEDFVTWTDTSKLKRKVMDYNDTLDDFDLL